MSLSVVRTVHDDKRNQLISVRLILRAREVAGFVDPYSTLTWHYHSDNRTDPNALFVVQHIFWQ